MCFVWMNVACPRVGFPSAFCDWYHCIRGGVVVMVGIPAAHGFTPLDELEVATSLSSFPGDTLFHGAESIPMEHDCRFITSHDQGGQGPVCGAYRYIAKGCPASILDEEHEIVFFPGGCPCAYWHLVNVVLAWDSGLVGKGDHIVAYYTDPSTRFW